MQLLPLEMRAQLPGLYAQEKNQDPTVICKFVCPWSDSTWLVTEGFEQDGKFIFYGYVIGAEEGWQYFGLSELEKIRGPGGLTIERDLQFISQPFTQANRAVPVR